MTVALTKVQTQVVWRSADTGDKTVSIPGSVPGNKGYDLDIASTIADSSTYVVTPTSGTINGAGSFSFTLPEDENCNLSLRSDADNSDWIVRCLCCTPTQETPGLGCTWTWSSITDLGADFWAAFPNVSYDGTKFAVNKLANTNTGYVSSDSGVTWNAVTFPTVMSFPVVGGFIMSKDGSTLYVQSSSTPGNDNLFRSLDFGLTWSGNLANPNIPDGNGSEGVPICSANGERVMRGGGWSSLRHAFLSYDYGTTWIDLTNFPYSFPITTLHPWVALAISGGGLTMIFSQIGPGFVTRISTDGGALWTNIEHLTWAAVSDDGGVIIGINDTRPGPLRKSLNGGGVFTDVPNPTAGDYYWGLVEVSGDGMIVSAVGRFGSPSGFNALYMSCDGGNTWAQQSGSAPFGSAFNKISGNGLKAISVAGLLTTYVQIAVRS